jgi:hypothetical protein
MTESNRQEQNAAAKDGNASHKAGPRCLVLALLLTVIPLLVAAVSVFVLLVIFANGGLLHSMSSQRLDRLVVEIEAFYMTEGEYPETLKALGLPGNEILRRHTRTVDIGRRWELLLSAQ